MHAACPATMFIPERTQTQAVNGDVKGMVSDAKEVAKDPKKAFENKGRELGKDYKDNIGGEPSRDADKRAMQRTGCIAAVTGGLAAIGAKLGDEVGAALGGAFCAGIAIMVCYEIYP